MAVVKTKLRQKRRYRIRNKIHGTSIRPRLSVFRSNKHIYAQLIDDDKGITLLSLSTKQLKLKNGSNIEAASKLGTELGKKTKDKKIKEVVFDRGGYKYHGRVKAVADACRKEGIKF